VAKATSENTRRAYRSDIRHFEQWGGRLPATTREVIRYLEVHATALNTRTLSRRLTALRQWHRFQGLTDPTQHPDVLATLRGIKKTHGQPKQAAPALEPQELLRMVDVCRSQHRRVDVRNKALLQLGFFGAFRASELVAIHVDDIDFGEQGMDILVRRSKTDTEGEGQSVSIPYGNEQLCAVTALVEWLAVSGIQSGPVFRRITQWDEIGHQALSAQSVSAILKSLQAECGLQKTRSLSSHSLRRGLATSASRSGASFKSIMKQGRWKHEGTVLQYIEEGQRFEDNAATAVLKKT
jgi:site-specific recombinase XerD